MERRSLILSTALLLLPAATFAMNYNDFHFGIGASLGSRTITIGDPTVAPASTTQNLLGSTVATSGADAPGTTTSLSHSTPTFVIKSHLLFAINENTKLKFGGDIYLSDTSKHTIYDGQSTTATVTLQTTIPEMTLTIDGGAAPTKDTVTVDQAATVGIDTILAGKRECTVSHQPAYGFNVRYAFGTDGNFSVGFGVIRTADTYKYTIENPPTGGTAGSGVYNSSDSDFSESFQIGVVTADWDATETAYEVTAAAVEQTYTTVLATTATYRDSINWIGFLADTASEINPHFVVYAGCGYYWKTLEPSSNAVTLAPMIATKSNATMSVAHIGFTFKPNTA